MREFSMPRSSAARTSGNLTDDVVRHARESPDAVLFTARQTGRPGTPERDVTAEQFLREVSAVARGMMAAGIRPGDRVGLLCRTCYEWTLVDYALWFAGAVSVPVYESSSAEQVGWILRNSGARAVVVQDAQQAAKVESAQAVARSRPLELVWTLAADGLADLARGGSEVSAEELEARRSATGPDDLATLVYTSGTTGEPRGCMLTHGHFMAELDGALAELGELFSGEQASTLLVLPLAHVFARLVQVGCVRARVRLGYCPQVAYLAEDLQAFRPTFLLAVPRVFEQLVNTASQQAVANGRGRMFERAVQAAIDWSRARETGRVPVRVRARHAVATRLVYRELLSVFGGRCAYAISGGAPLGDRLGHFYAGLGLPVLEGYGLSETTGAVTANVPGALKVGTVGRPLPGTAVRVADDGELLVQGPQVFAGYWEDEHATAEVLSARGWLHTGDLGEIDDEGFVRITGRKREILITAGGKNVAPAPLEERIRAHRLVSQCLVLGDGRPFVAALVTLDHDAVSSWAAGLGKRGTVADLAHDRDLRAEVAGAIEEANRSVSRAEAVRRFEILPVDWTEEAGQLTPSLKLRRQVVMRQYADVVAALYARG